jgi:hypothetical protein
VEVDISQFPNLMAILDGRISGQLQEWPAIRGELQKLLMVPPPFQMVSAGYVGADWYGKDCPHQCCQWEDSDQTQTPVLIYCSHKYNPGPDCEGNCQKQICPLEKP